MLTSLSLRLGLPLAEAIVGVLPSRVAYALADLAGSLWYRFAPERRALVTENQRRVAAALGRPTDAGSLRRTVRLAFREHARYYLELLRVPTYRLERIDEHVSVRDWERWEPVVRGAVVIAIAHFGNFEPFGVFVARHGIVATAPAEEISPRELFDFLRARRGAGHVTVVPLSRARRPMVEALRRGEVVALAADRDLGGDGIAVTFFGHDATIPAGPATLAVMTGAPLLMASCIRLGPDRFEARAWPVEADLTGDRRDTIEALTRALVVRFEAAISEAPEQWWGTFQPIWTDQKTGRPA